MCVATTTSECVWVFRNRSMHTSPDPNRACEVWMAVRRVSQARTICWQYMCASCTFALCEESESDAVPRAFSPTRCIGGVYFVELIPPARKGQTPVARASRWSQDTYNSITMQNQINYKMKVNFHSITSKFCEKKGNYISGGTGGIQINGEDVQNWYGKHPKFFDVIMFTVRLVQGTILCEI